MAATHIGTAETLRARMAAWDRSFELGHGRPPEQHEWASAARAVGHLPIAEAEALARATYHAFGESAAAAPAQPEYSEFAQAIMARRHRGAARAKAALRRHDTHPMPGRQALGGGATSALLAGIAFAVWFARRARRVAA